MRKILLHFILFITLVLLSYPHVNVYSEDGNKKDTPKKVVYLTFDDGPSTTNTPGILDVLDRYNVKATIAASSALESSSSDK